MVKQNWFAKNFPMQCHPEQSEESRVHQRGCIRDSSLAFRMTNVFRNSFLIDYKKHYECPQSINGGTDGCL